MKLPNPQWIQTNTSDKFGNIAYSKNLNFDEEGYLSLSPRAVKIYDNTADAQFDIPSAIGRYSGGSYLLATLDEPFEATTSTTAITIAEDSGTGNPNMDTNSHGKWWQNRWYATGNDNLYYRTSASNTWTALSPTLSGSGVRRYLEVFASRTTLCITDGNLVRQLTTAHAADTTLTLPADYEAIGLAYNNSRLGIITRLGTSTSGQNSQSRFYVWDGATTGATSDFAIGADAAIAVCAYKSSFAILTRKGQLLYFNGGGFEPLAAFPFYNTKKQWGALLGNSTFGDTLVSDGDRILINIGLQLNEFGRRNEKAIPECPSGVWCFDPKVGLTHRYSPSLSQAYLVSVANGNVDTATNVITRTAGTIPVTGNIARYTDAAGTSIGGLTQNQDYYIIKVSASTFKLATTKENALAGAAIDLTSDGSNTSYFWMYDLVDYGQIFNERSGAVALAGQDSVVFSDIIFGGEYFNTALTDAQALCIIDPFLENRGYVVTAKSFAENVTDASQKICIKHAPLGDGEEIRVKVRGRDVRGLPVTSSNESTTEEANWTSPTELYTTTDLSDALTALSSGEELEIELIAGVGAGQCVKVNSVEEGSGTYALVLDESVIGATSGLKSFFIINNWKQIGTVTSASNRDGYMEFNPELKTKWLQAKAELIGVDIKIEEFAITSTPNK
jgi:hypothetical protein